MPDESMDMIFKFRLPGELLGRIHEEAELRGISASALIRSVLAKHHEDMRKKD